MNINIDIYTLNIFRIYSEYEYFLTTELSDTLRYEGYSRISELGPVNRDDWK